MECTFTVQATVVDMKCNRCSRDGKMRPMTPINTGAALFPHVCTACKDLQVYDKVYPYIKFNSEDLNEKDILYNGQIMCR